MRNTFFLACVVIALLFLLAFITPGCAYKYYEHKAIVTEKGFKRVGQDKPLTLIVGDTINIVTRK